MGIIPGWCSGSWGDGGREPGRWGNDGGEVHFHNRLRLGESFARVEGDTAHQLLITDPKTCCTIVLSAPHWQCITHHSLLAVSSERRPMDLPDLALENVLPIPD